MVSFAILLTSIAYGANCRITEETMGFRDREAHALSVAAEIYKQATGDSGPQLNNWKQTTRYSGCTGDATKPIN